MNAMTKTGSSVVQACVICAAPCGSVVCGRDACVIDYEAGEGQNPFGAYTAESDADWAERERMGEDEAWECGEVAAMRREAEREARMEAASYEAELEEESRENALRFPGGFCALDWDGIRMFTCETEDDNIPF